MKLRVPRSPQESLIRRGTGESLVGDGGRGKEGEETVGTEGDGRDGEASGGLWGETVGTGGGPPEDPSNSAEVCGAPPARKSQEVFGIPRNHY